VRVAFAELRDPSGLTLALLTAVAARLVQPNLLIAVAVGVAVLALKSLTAGLLAVRRAPPPAEAVSDLTRRELEVARYVGLGLTNKEIGTRLGADGRGLISERTVDNHVQHILTKLDFHSRAQIAAWAAERGLLQDRQK
jgi:DNA-binding NarL/FixJ family response regulator